MVPFILQSQNYKTMEMKKRLFVARDYKGREGLFWGGVFWGEVLWYSVP